MLTLNKFLLKVFNRLSHDCKVNRPLIARFLLDLPDYYTPNTPDKLINLFILKAKFPSLISRQTFNTNNDVAYINSGKV